MLTLDDIERRAKARGWVVTRDGAGHAQVRNGELYVATLVANRDGTWHWLDFEDRRDAEYLDGAAERREGAARVLSVVAQVAALKQGQRLAWVAGAGERRDGCGEGAMIVIVTGGRTYSGTGLVEKLDELEREARRLCVFVGDCPPGADRIAREWAGDRAIVFEARWDVHGRKAGPFRNEVMVGTARQVQPPQVVLCLAAPGGRGTADCVRRCREAGFEVMEVTT